MIQSIICKIFYHKLFVERHLGNGSRKIGCTRCGKHWAMNDETKSFLEWDGDFEQLYRNP